MLFIDHERSLLIIHAPSFKSFISDVFINDDYEKNRFGKLFCESAIVRQN